MGGDPLSELGDLLELMHTSRDRWNAAAAKGFEWRVPALLTEAFMRAIPKGAVTFSGSGNTGELPEEQEETWSLWVRQPSDYRAKFDVGDDRVEVVIKEHWWWDWSPRWGARTNEGQENHGHGLGPGEVLFRPADVLGALRLESPLAEVEVAGRQSLLVKAVPILVDERTPYDDEESYIHSGLHGVGSGADEFQFHIDVESGVILRSEAILAGHPFRILYMTELTIDPDFGEGTFRIEPPNGEQFVRA